MIKTLSSYYINVPLVSPLTGLTCTSFVLKLYVWNGLKTDAPTEATYTLTEQNPEALTDTKSVNIARLINDFITFTPQVITTNYQDGNNQIWVKQEVYYTTSDIGEINTAQLVETNLSIKGYGYAMEGLNPTTPTDKILLTNREFKVGRNSKFIVPIVIEETAIPTPSITITNVTSLGGNDYELTFTFVGSYDDFFATITPTSGTPEITPSFATTSPQTITITLTGSLDVKMFGYDNDSSTNVTSNIFNIVI